MRRRIGIVILCVCAAACGARQEPRRAADRPAAARTPSAKRVSQPVAEAPLETGRAPAPAPAPPADAPAPPPDGQQSIFVPTAADQVFVHRVLNLIDEVVTIVERHQDACDRMATDLEGMVQRNQDLIAAATRMKGDLERGKWMQEQVLPRLEKSIPRLMTGFQKCQNDARMQALIRRLSS